MVVRAARLLAWTSVVLVSAIAWGQELPVATVQVTFDEGDDIEPVVSGNGDVLESEVCPSGMIAYWTFDDPADLSSDASGAHPGQPMNGASSTEGVVGTALQVDGEDDYFGTAGELLGDDRSFTLEFWLRSDRDGVPELVVSNLFGDHCQRWRAGFDVTLDEFGYLIFGAVGFGTADSWCLYADNSVVSRSPIEAGQWYHLAFVRNLEEETVAIFVNGELDNAEHAVYPGYNDNGFFNLGGHYPPWPDYISKFSGAFDEAALYSRALSSEELRNHYYAGARAAQGYCGSYNQPPLASVEESRTVQVGVSSTLDASATTDPEGDDVSFAWTLVSSPPGSTATLDDAHAAAPVLTADVAGEYVVELVVSDQHGAADPKQVRIRASRLPPPERTWTRQFGTEAWDDAHAVALEPDGSIIVVGSVDGELDGELHLEHGSG